MNMKLKAKWNVPRLCFHLLRLSPQPLSFSVISVYSLLTAEVSFLMSCSFISCHWLSTVLCRATPSGIRTGRSSSSELIACLELPDAFSLALQSCEVSPPTMRAFRAAPWVCHGLSFEAPLRPHLNLYYQIWIWQRVKTSYEEKKKAVKWQDAKLSDGPPADPQALPRPSAGSPTAICRSSAGYPMAHFTVLNKGFYSLPYATVAILTQDIWTQVGSWSLALQFCVLFMATDHA